MKIFWTFKALNAPTEVGFGSPLEFIRWLERNALAHVPSPDWIIDLLGYEQPDGTATYEHQREGKVVWSLTWGKPQPGLHDTEI